jgi:hypothetical protein
MANPRIQPGRALSVIASDDAEIPFPTVNSTGTDTAAPIGNQLIDNTKDFVVLNVAPGDIVYNLTTGLAATITDFANPTTPDTLELNASIFTGAGDSYVIYQSGPMSGGGQNSGCVLYVGSVGDVRVLTTDYDDVTFFGVQTGTFMPVQVRKVFASGTNASSIVALW